MAVCILYDGACPFCSAYVRYTRLKARLGEVELIDARQAPDLVAAYAADGYDIDDSFIVDDGRRVLVHGAAMAFIHGQIAPRWTGLPYLADRRLLEAIYPALRGMRNSALRLLGVPLIAAAQKSLKAGAETEEPAIEPVENRTRRREAT